MLRITHVLNTLRVRIAMGPSTPLYNSESDPLPIPTYFDANRTSILPGRRPSFVAHFPRLAHPVFHGMGCRQCHAVALYLGYTPWGIEGPLWWQHASYIVARPFHGTYSGKADRYFPLVAAHGAGTNRDGKRLSLVGGLPGRLTALGNLRR